MTPVSDLEIALPPGLDFEKAPFSATALQFSGKWESPDGNAFERLTIFPADNEAATATSETSPEGATSVSVPLSGRMEGEPLVLTTQEPPPSPFPGLGVTTTAYSLQKSDATTLSETNRQR